MMMDDNIIDLRQSRSMRPKPKPSHVVGKCRHLQVYADAHRRQLECRNCGATIEAFDWIATWAADEDRYQLAINELRKEKEKLHGDIADLKRERANAASARNRALIAANKGVGS